MFAHDLFSEISPEQQQQQQQPKGKFKRDGMMKSSFWVYAKLELCVGVMWAMKEKMYNFNSSNN